MIVWGRPFTRLPSPPVFCAQLIVIGGLAAIWHSPRPARAWLLIAGIVGLWFPPTVLFAIVLNPFKQAAFFGVRNTVIVREYAQTAFLIATPAVAAFLALSWVRRVKRLSVQQTTAAWRREFRPGRFQFSIRHMFVLTAAVAVIITSGHAIRFLRQPANVAAELFKYGGVPYWGIQLGIAFLTGVVCMVTICVASVWACFGLPRVYKRLLLVGLLAVGLPAAVIYLFQIGGPGGRRGMFLTFMLPTAIVNATFLVIRSCGYRLLPTSDGMPPVKIGRPAGDSSDEAGARRQ